MNLKIVAVLVGLYILLSSKDEKDLEKNVLQEEVLAFVGEPDREVSCPICSKKRRKDD